MHKVLTNKDISLTVRGRLYSSCVRSSMLHGSGEWQKVTLKAVRWPCGVCGRGVGNNSIQCTNCKKWVHRKCSGIKGSMYKVISHLFVEVA